MLLLFVLGLLSPVALGSMDPDVCEGFSCPAGQICIPRDVVCVTFPCYPQPECVPFDVCEGFDCPCGETCRPQEVQCVTAPCFPVAHCVSGDNPGQCPSTEGLIGICVEECSSDADCGHKQKCCSNGCGHTCQDPVGFCEATPAQDETAIEMCSFLLDSDSPFYECTKLFSLDLIKYLFMECTDVYCEKGIDGLCDFVTLFLSVCENRFEVFIEEKLDVCVPLCTEEPNRDPAAIEACSFIIDSNSPFADCSEKFSLEEIKDIFQRCTEIYCVDGIPGVCEYAEQLIIRCKDEVMIVINELPEMCGLCVGNPAKDENAIEACSFLLDSDSPFYDCTKLLDIGVIKSKFQTCTEIYCEKGIPGVCEFATTFKEKCETLGVTVEEMPDGCSVTKRDLCEENPTQDESAIEACQFFIDTDSPFAECTYQIDLDTIKANFTDCLFTYCEYGQEGVCDIIIHLIFVCERIYDVTIDIPDACDICEEDPSRDEDAIKACSFLLDSNSAFYECSSLYSLDAIKELFLTCTGKYCESGQPGVCDFVEDFKEQCEEDFGVVIEEVPEGCDSFCVMLPSRDPTAISMCSFVIDSNSPFYECTQFFDISRAKELLKNCTEHFCESGVPGVCVFSDYLIDICEKDYGTPVDQLDVCLPPPTPSTTTPLVCQAPPSKDENAIAACSFLFDSDVDFYECSKLFDLDEIKDLFMECTEIYCADGTDGVCSFTHTFIGRCVSEKGVEGITLPPVCVA